MLLHRRDMLRVSGRLLVGSSVAWVTACATTKQEPASAPRSHRSLHPRVVVTAPASLPATDAGWVEEVLPDALARLATFELSLSTRVEVRLHASRTSFERDTGRSAAWLRAWAGYDVVHLLPPSTWRDASREARLERLTHELAHAATFQALGDEATARRVQPPFWFREGAASLVAQQGPRRMPLPLVVERAGEADPLTSAEEWLTRDHYVAYAAAHHAVTWLAARHGDGVVAAILRRAREDGQRGAVDRALERVCQVRLAEVWPALLRDSA